MVWLKRLIPEVLQKIVRPYYHGALALLASWYYGRPSRRLTVIGVTGTSGKSTTVLLLSHLLNQSGRRAGYVTTAGWSDGARPEVNRHGLSMPGGPLLQRYLKGMVASGCRYAVVECTSEGLAQNRHLGVDFDVALFTNLSPAHQDAHGSFASYRSAKGKLFSALGDSFRKPGVEKRIGVNLDDREAPFFSGFAAAARFGVTLAGVQPVGFTRTYAATALTDGFSLNGQDYRTNLPGAFNVQNALLASACALELGVGPGEIVRALPAFSGAPGRMERITAEPFSVFVDYAPEPSGMRAALRAVRAMGPKRLIHVFGSTGGHRDVSKRFEFGELSAREADLVIVTNDDVYGSDPEEIARNIREGTERVPQSERRAREVRTVLDRREAIGVALSLAEPGDLVLITGKGSEQFLVLPENRRIPWDDRTVVREELAQLKKRDPLH